MLLKLCKNGLLDILYKNLQSNNIKERKNALVLLSNITSETDEFLELIISSSIL
jgi:hypothetical protein